MLKSLLMLFSFALLSAGNAHADRTLEQSIERLQHEWAIVNYQTPKDQKESAYKTLSDMAHEVTQRNPGRAEPMIWEAIILSSYAGAKGGLGALSLVKQSRDLLLSAEKIDPRSLNGSIYTSLGSLYYKVPGWPIGFGDHDKAKEYLNKALQMNPTGIDPLYFYGDLMLDEGNYAKAAEFFKRALTAPPRPGREDADAGRRIEIQAGLRKAEQK